MKMTHLLAAAATLALAGGSSALAGDPAKKQDSAVNPHAGHTAEATASTTSEPTVSASSTTESTTTDSATTATTATSATSVGTAASVTTTMVSNGPVPDTAENRAKYGQPLSRAGKRTAPAGN